MNKEYPECWLAALAGLARARGDPPSALKRAEQLCRQLGLAPWIALGVAVGRIRLADAAILDRAVKCKELQGAVLDQGLPLAELRTRMPFAPYFLAGDLLAAGIPGLRRMSDALAVAKSLLNRELPPITRRATNQTVCRQPLEIYCAETKIILAMAATHGLDLASALEVAAGELPLAAAERRAAIKREDTRNYSQWRRPAADDHKLDQRRDRQR